MRAWQRLSGSNPIGAGMLQVTQGERKHDEFRDQVTLFLLLHNALAYDGPLKCPSLKPGGVSNRPK
jgi:hypothetical protein